MLTKFRFPTACAVTLGVLAMFATPNQASATLIGDAVSCSTSGGFLDPCIPVLATVGAGVEFTFGDTFGPLFDVDIGASVINLTFTSLSGALFGFSEILTIADLDWVGMPTFEITGFSLGGTSSLAASAISTLAHSVTVDLTGFLWANGNTAIISLTTADAAQVAEPASLAVFSLGLIGLGFARRRRAA